MLPEAVVEAASCLNSLAPDAQRVWDGTTGLAGHLLLLAAAYPKASLYASDADAEMLKLARERAGGKITEYRQGNFGENPFRDKAPFAFIFFDLGISSAHFDFFERGFSFRFDQPLDMRMNAESGISAARLLATAEEKELARIFFEFGEEKLSRRIAREIVERRKVAPITTTRELTEICEHVYPPKYKAKGHADRYPATRVFQALRIAVNGELDALASALKFAPDQLSVGGRLAILSFHSLEDRLVKHAFRDRAFIKETDPTAKSNFKPGDYRLVEPGGITPNEKEIAENPRARSARLRILERIR
nr:16S rRNA (cytosine(1402)-N(4))-methyltransferase RsmH [Turneriella parva]